MASRVVTIGSTALPVREWLKRAGISRQAYFLRKASGMSEREALATPKCAARKPLMEINGQRFGRLVVESRAAPNRHGQARYNCVCDCGARTVVDRSNIRSGHTRSCGCLVNEPHNVTHGHASDKRGRSAEYVRWWSMRMKCERPGYNGYSIHGAKGIRVCARWRTFEPFLKDMGPCPDRSWSLARRNPNGNFTPANCYWAPRRRGSA